METKPASPANNSEILLTMYCSILSHLLSAQGYVPVYLKEKLVALGRGARFIQELLPQRGKVLSISKSKTIASRLHLPPPI